MAARRGPGGGGTTADDGCARVTSYTRSNELSGICEVRTEKGRLQIKELLICVA